MPEIEHSTFREPVARLPALPISADVLLEQEIEQRKRFSGFGERISSGCGVLDGLFACDGKGNGGRMKENGGGVERGIVVGVSAGEGGEGLLISLNLLASLLLPHLSSPSPSPPPTLTNLITPSTFPLPLLARVLKSRIRSSLAEAKLKNTTTGNFPVSGAGQEEKENEEEVERMVKRALQMIAISRVFDIEGLQEVLSEISTASPSQPSPERTAEIIDSEDSDAELSPIRSPTRKREGQEYGVQMVVVDNTTSLITDLLNRAEKSEAHKLLTSLSRTISHLTHSLNLLTILHNSTTPTSPVSRNINQGMKSIFNDSSHRPALGAVFSQFLDVHLFISSLPKLRRDAEVLYGQEGGEEVGRCLVVEVLKDESAGGERGYGGREERWVAVEVGEDGTGFVGAFADKGTMRGMGLEREKRVQDVGSVAKIWGFGGRRV